MSLVHYQTKPNKPLKIMNKKTFFLLITLFCIKFETKITHILIDPNALFRTSHSAAAGHVGKWESLKYAGETGHLPSQNISLKHFKVLKLYQK